MRTSRWAFLFLLVPALLGAQGLPIKSGSTSTLASVDTNNNVRIAEGASVRPTYIASAGGLVTTAAYALAVESEVSRGFRIQSICVGTSAATAAALQTVTVRRQTAASSGGTAVTAEGTGASGVAQLVPGTGNWAGVVRITGTAGTAGALLDTWGWTVGEIGAGAADPGSPGMFCKTYGMNGTQMPTAASGVANGVDIRVTAAGAGGLASGAITVTFIAE